jgi:hypothetical protein
LRLCLASSRGSACPNLIPFCNQIAEVLIEGKPVLFIKLLIKVMR